MYNYDDFENNIKLYEAAQSKMAFSYVDSSAAQRLKEKGNEAFGRRNYGYAISCYLEAIAYDPKIKEVWLNLALCYVEFDNTTKAIDAFNIAIGLDPKYLKAIYNKLKVLSKQKNRELTLDLINNYIRANNDNPNPLISEIEKAAKKWGWAQWILETYKGSLRIEKNSHATTQEPEKISSNMGQLFTGNNILDLKREKKCLTFIAQCSTPEDLNKFCQEQQLNTYKTNISILQALLTWLETHEQPKLAKLIAAKMENPASEEKTALTETKNNPKDEKNQLESFPSEQSAKQIIDMPHSAAGNKENKKLAASDESTPKQEVFLNQGSHQVDDFPNQEFNVKPELRNKRKRDGYIKEIRKCKNSDNLITLFSELATIYLPHQSIHEAITEWIKRHSFAEGKAFLEKVDKLNLLSAEIKSKWQSVLDELHKPSEPTLKSSFISEDDDIETYPHPIQLDEQILHPVAVLIKKDSEESARVIVSAHEVQKIEKGQEAQQPKRSDFYEDAIKSHELYGDDEEVVNFISYEDDKFAKTESELKINARSYGYECRNVKPNGNCFYLAVADQLNLILKLNLSPEEIIQLSAKLRNHACEYIKNNRSSIDKASIKDDELEKQNQNGIWVDGMPIIALCYALNVSLVLVCNYRQNPIINRINNSICTLYLGYQKDLHYQSLIPLDEIGNKEKQGLLEAQLQNDPFLTLNCATSIKTLGELKTCLENLLIEIPVTQNQQPSIIVAPNQSTSSPGPVQKSPANSSYRAAVAAPRLEKIPQSTIQLAQRDQKLASIKAAPSIIIKGVPMQYVVKTRKIQESEKDGLRENAQKQDIQALETTRSLEEFSGYNVEINKNNIEQRISAELSTVYTQSHLSEMVISISEIPQSTDFLNTDSANISEQLPASTQSLTVQESENNPLIEQTQPFIPESTDNLSSTKSGSPNRSVISAEANIETSIEEKTTIFVISEQARSQEEIAQLKLQIEQMREEMTKKVETHRTNMSGLLEINTELNKIAKLRERALESMSIRYREREVKSRKEKNESDKRYKQLERSSKWLEHENNQIKKENEKLKKELAQFKTPICVSEQLPQEVQQNTLDGSNLETEKSVMSITQQMTFFKSSQVQKAQTRNTPPVTFTLQGIQENKIEQPELKARPRTQSAPLILERIQENKIEELELKNRTRSKSV